MSDELNTPGMGEELNNVIILSDEEGNNVEFEFLDLIEFDGEEYVVLLPIEEDEEGIVILRVEDSEDDDEMENYVSIDDDDTVNQVFEIFKEKFKDEFDFIDED